jgi:hypothetical protein
VARQQFFCLRQTETLSIPFLISLSYKYSYQRLLSVLFLLGVTDMRMVATSFIAFFLLATINLNVYAFKSYSQYQLWRLHVTNNEQIGKLLDFSRIAYKLNINFWSEEFHVDRPVNFLISYFALYLFLN